MAGIFMRNCVSGILLVIMTGLIISCVSSPPPGMQAPGANESSIIIQRARKIIASALPVNVYIDGVARMTLKNGDSGRIIIPNGSYLLEIKSRDSGANVSMQINVNSETVNLSLIVNHMSGSVLIETNRIKLSNEPTGIEGALERAAEEVSENFTARTRIAIVFITAQDRSTTEFITGELEHILRRQGYVIIDRSELDRVRREQNFQLGGEVDDDTAISIGRFSGANIIITGRVDGEGNLRRLRLRALDTQSAEVVGTASERL